MQKDEIKKEFENLATNIVIKKGLEKKFMTEIYSGKYPKLFTIIPPSVGLTIASLLSILGVNFAATSVTVGGIFGLFGTTITVLNPVVLIPFIISALVSAGIGIGITIKKNSDTMKSTTATPKDLLCHMMLSTIYIPVLIFFRNNTLDKPFEYLEKKLKTKFNDLGCSEEYINSFFCLFTKLKIDELRILAEILCEVTIKLQYRLPGDGKLYKKDFKENALIRKANELCNKYNSEFCDNVDKREQNEKFIGDYFSYIEEYYQHLTEQNRQDKIAHQQYSQEVRRLEKETEEINKIKFDCAKSLLKYTNEYNDAIENIYELAKIYTPAEKYLNKLNSSKNNTVLEAVLNRLSEFKSKINFIDKNKE
ncbi:MAG: hypothetical protein UH788_01145 [Treponemataceae bacterium]|nr:hypothetical protein [Treponemataceae bacterium]